MLGEYARHDLDVISFFGLMHPMPCSRWLGLVTSIARILGGSSNPTGVRQCVVTLQLFFRRKV